MPKRVDIVNLARDQQLRESPRQATSMSLPLAVHHRLDRLAEMAEAVGATRGEIIGMLIAGTDPEAEYMERQILAYRKMLVGDVVPPQRDDEDSEVGSDSNIVSIAMRRPGRPARREAQ
jgi:hypothetical protein